MSLDERIHRAIYAAAHNDLLEATLERVLRPRTADLDDRARSAHEDLEEAVEAHRDLHRGDPSSADGDRAADAHARPRPELRAGDASRAPDRVRVAWLTFPHAKVRRDRRRHRRQQPGRLARRARLDRPRPDRQGAVPEPRRLDRPRLELHLPGRPLEGDDAAHARVDAPVPRDRNAARVRRHRGRAHARSGWRSCAAGWPRRSRGASTTVGSSRPAEIKELVPFVDESILLGGFYSPSVGGRRLAPLRDDHARARAGRRARRSLPNTEVLGIDVEDGRVRARPHDPRRRRRRRRRDRLRRLGSAHRAQWPARRSR